VNLGDLFGGGADIGALVVSGHGLAATKQGVAAQCNNDTHGNVL
jgi:hypothetical protein